VADPEKSAAQPDIAALAIAEQRYRALVRATSSLVWTTSPDGQIVDMPEWRDYTGITVAQIRGWGWLDSLHPDDRERTASVWQQAVDSRSLYETEYRIRRRDGAYVWHQVRGVPILDANGSIREWVGLCLDIDLRKRAEEKRIEAETALRDLNENLEHRVELEARERARMQGELAHANRVATIGQLTASIAHEIKHPIAAARTNAAAALRFLGESPPDVAEVREALTCIVNETDRAGDVVDRIGSLIKKAPPRKEVVDLNAAILEVTALTRSEAVKSSVTVSTQLAGDLPRIQCDLVQLQQVMLNLIINAIQSMSGIEDGNRQLHISTVHIKPEGVCVAVRDTGHGLRPENVPRLFEPFYTTKPDGMGMGLSICRSIIEAHGGRLWATGCEPRGALFQFTIPAD
jgi:PAS domain S-box-containing protein